jgi:hypothetical protein
VQESIDALLAISLLPAPNGRAAEPGLARHFDDRQALGGRQDDLRRLDMLERTVAVANNGGQSLEIFGRDDDIDGLGHAARFAHPRPNVNLVKASVH